MDNVVRTEVPHRYRVYKNIHKSSWSIMDTKTNLIVGHSKNLHLDDCHFIVNKAGKKKVQQEKVKNVHAYIEGNIVDLIDFTSYKNRLIELSTPHVIPYVQNFKKIVYNPYDEKNFYIEDTLQEIITSPKVFMFFINGNKKSHVTAVANHIVGDA